MSNANFATKNWFAKGILTDSSRRTSKMHFWFCNTMSVQLQLLMVLLFTLITVWQINLVKSDFAQAEVKVQLDTWTKRPKQSIIIGYQNKKWDVMRFLDRAGYHHTFCKNYFHEVAHLKNFRNDVRYKWFNLYEAAIKKIKTMLVSSPDRVSPNYNEQFLLHVDTSDIWADAVLCWAVQKNIISQVTNSFFNSLTLIPFYRWCE